MIYGGKVVNITKFGAFVNVLPGRDGLLHISKLSALTGGKRVNSVEDVVVLGQAIEVRVDDIDPQGKVSLSLAGDNDAAAGDTGADSGSNAPRPRHRARVDRPRRARPSRMPSRPSWWQTSVTWVRAQPTTEVDRGATADRGGDRRSGRGRPRRR